MHPRIAELTKELLQLFEKGDPTIQPTEDDRKSVMTVLGKIKSLRDEPDITLSDSDEKDYQCLYWLSTYHSNIQEDFFESNGNKWAT